ncbi:enkurin-like isoform X1 [Neoarius graeffei]|uniref:enkurin-like isoform X1 n=1 Tax=Neoarius graeffei TaxID=443677 RepID=UPI00298D39CE|nr:enkurin-like isoform X1 [Neoarius graeffei]
MDLFRRCRSLNPQTTPSSGQRYMSKFRMQLKQENQQNKASYKTMGPVKVEKPSPDKYLLKHSKEPKLPEKKTFSYGDVQPRKPQIPAKTKQLLTVGDTKRNFVKSNVMENTMVVPHQPQSACAQTKYVDKELLENSGLIRKFVKKKDYGQTPEYLSQRQEEVRRAQEKYDHYVKEKMKEGAIKQFSEEERLNILHGLKKNLDELQHQYQGLSVITDTVPKRHRKEKLESQMKQLEKDIELVKRYKTIYITEN